ncbi:sulfite exporter TauE/SafE family protein [Opitutaceae bacterium TAV4]|uniref:sulfite exporter TauE/SafE family protein n=1 Tax=Geminisphaera colitermitum TaxID=1148786 RepID=UPI000158CF12|nr:sulfite exporter TauE/SafE family protein [Geminisphaera colitermitum]RRJ96879.1 sulfite exporter TauE/SafE family protein [Opitutaceae bacterium TAV4]RRK00821.1 sulfite exporter TauE/SafE family protein [Opitutaceae bacterium TAV3]
MTPLLFTLIIALISISAGALGSLVGVGGGIIVVPALTLLMGVDIQHAIAASIVAVVATSSGAASSYVRERITNIRLAMVMEIATAVGAICGAFLAVVVSGRWLFLLFGLVLCYTAWSMSRKSQGHLREPVPDALADRLRLHSSYYDRSLKQEISYRVSRTRLGLVVSYVAGVVSGLLGIGGGVLKVPVMNLAMGLPIKVCTATSNFMIGVTAAASAAVYFMRGDVKPFIAAPVAVGVLVGARIGARLLGRLKGEVIKRAFVIVLAVSALQMLWNGIVGKG